MNALTRAFTLVLLAGFTVLLGLAGGIAKADTIYVCWDGSGDFLTIQEGIDAAEDGDEVVVCDGTYTGAGNKNLNFGGKAITVRSENGPTNCVIDCEQDGSGFGFGSGETRAAIVDGLTIMRGEAFEGGAIACDGGSPTIRNCVLVGNTAWLGGGIWCATDPLVIGCTITGNTALGGQWYGEGGGGAYCLLGSRAAFSGCTISGNEAMMSGGGVCCFDSPVELVDCTIVENTSLYRGGGITIVGNLPTIINCTIASNTAQCGGGAFAFDSGSLFVNCAIAGNVAEEAGGVFSLETLSGCSLVNCTITGNEADSCGGIKYVGYECVGGDGIIASCVVWGNIPTEITFECWDCPTVSYCDVRGGWPGEGNIDADPLFVDPDGPDDDPGTWEDNNHRISPGSPCIDAADNDAVPPDVTTDLDGNPRFVDDPATDDTGNGMPPIVDMGAYEFQVGIRAFLDIKPGACPNPLNRGSHGVCPVALVGTEDFDVTQVDLDSLELTRADGLGGSVRPLRGPPGPGIRVQDVATPFDGEPCDCHELHGDGIADLGMKFDMPEMAAVLELDDFPGGALVELTLSGELLDTTRFSASDCVILVPPGPGPGAPPEEAGLKGDGVEAVPEARRADLDAGQDADGPNQLGPQPVGCGVLPPGFLLTVGAAMYLVGRARAIAW